MRALFGGELVTGEDKDLRMILPSGTAPPSLLSLPGRLCLSPSTVAAISLLLHVRPGHHLRARRRRRKKGRENGPKLAKPRPSL